MKRVRWEIDVDAADPQVAAEKALAIQRRLDSTATVFDVTDEQGESVRVDLDENAGQEVLECDNCGRRFREDEIENKFPDIPYLLERIEPGGIVPFGECPVHACRALVYRKAEPVRVLVLLDGGLVQGVLANRDGVEAAVLDQDLDGVDEDEIVELVGQVNTLRGTLSAHDVNVAPAVIESAWRTVE